ncbi:MAG: DUF4363 family protein [Oscillospiraceae bacterium]|nr:DUF4363 family protein [Oscillospiraceae bacterium]
MKRLWIAAALLAVALILCVWSQIVQQRSLSSLIDMATRLQTSAQREADAQAFVAAYEEKTSLFAYFMRHRDIDDIQKYVVALPALANDEDQFQAVLAQCIYAMECLKRSELPLPENII